MTQNIQGLVDVGRLVLTFARVNRATRHEDGITPESDTDHTVMLSLCACALGQKLYSELDQGRIAQFALVHDLVEAYAEVTDSFGLTDAARQEKERREEAALHRIEHEFESVFPRIAHTIRAYEKQDTKEAQFVKILDKLMPKITHMLNHCGVFRERGETVDTIREHLVSQRNELDARYGADFGALIGLLDESIDAILRDMSSQKTSS